MDVTSQWIEEKVRDFYRWHAPQDASRAAIALSLGLSPYEVLSMLCAKYKVPMALVQQRSRLFDDVVRRFQDHHVPQPEVAALNFLEGVQPSQSPDEAHLLRSVDSVVVARRPASPPAARSAQRVTHVDLSPGGELPSFTPGTTDAAPQPAPVAPSPQPLHSLPHPSPQLKVAHQSRTAVATGQLMQDYVAPGEVYTTLVDSKAAAGAKTLQAFATSSDALDDPSLAVYHQRLVEIETKLFQRCLDVQQAHDDLVARTAELQRREQAVQRDTEALRSATELHGAAAQQKDIELAESAAKLAAERTFADETMRRLNEQQRHLDHQARTLEDREAKVAASLQAVASREAAVASQAKLVDSERHLCQRLSSEVLKREAAVRLVEKQLATAKTEVVRLEDELSARAKQVLEDEASTRRWATELEKRELTVQSIFEQLRHKGIHVSF